MLTFLQLNFNANKEHVTLQRASIVKLVVRYIEKETKNNRVQRLQCVTDSRGENRL